ncbi:MAG: hypothetical protein DRJ05_10600 [Bacteroidetes bacterium]|nr:MAG: hypothetical protein DRJ05_10600 [Bacteroidota bacterium]
MEKIQFSIILILISLSLFAQNPPGTYIKKNHYAEGKITLHDNLEFNAKDISIESYNISFVNKFDGAIKRIPYSEIDELKIKKGTKAVSGAIYGAVIPFIFILEGLVDNEPNQKNTGIRVVGFLAGCSLVGAFIGSQITVYETYNFISTGKVDMSMGYNFRIDKDMIGAQLVINF